MISRIIVLCRSMMMFDGFWVVFVEREREKEREKAFEIGGAEIQR
jgi:hypothetical protein